MKADFAARFAKTIKLKTYITSIINLSSVPIEVKNFEIGRTICIRSLFEIFLFWMRLNVFEILYKQ